MADDDDVAMREADAGLGADDEHDGARAGALARPSAPGAQRVGARFCTRARASSFARANRHGTGGAGAYVCIIWM